MYFLSAKTRLHRSEVFLLLLIVLSGIVIVFGRLPGDGLLWRELQNTGHTFIFGMIALAMLKLLRSLFPELKNKSVTLYLFAAAASFIFGALTEVAQWLTQREPSVEDLIRDLLGIVASLGLYASVDPAIKFLREKHWSSLKTGVIAFCLSLLAISLFPVAHLSIAILQRNEAHPVIIDFNAGWSRSFLQLNQATLSRVSVPVSWKSVSSDMVTIVRLKPAKYPGMTMFEPCPDWSEFNTMSLDIFSTSAETFELVLRVHDRLHNDEFSDRFNQSLTVVPGKNNYSILLRSVQFAPESRQMDMRQIAEVRLFAVEPGEPVEFYPGILSLQ